MRETKQRWHVSPRARQRLAITGIFVIVLFVVANALLWLVYRDRTYPRTKVMNTSIGSVAYDDLSSKMNQVKLLPSEVQLVYGDKKATIPLHELGMHKDLTRTTASAAQQRFWLPVVNLFKTPELQAPIRINKATFSAKTHELSQSFRSDPTNAHLTLANGEVGIAAAKDGFELEQSELQAAVVRSLDKGKTILEPPIKQTKPKLQAKDLKDDRAALATQLKITVTYRYNGKSKQATPNEIAQWFVPSGDIFVLAPDKVQAYITSVGQSFGIRVKGIDQVVSKTDQALKNNSSLDLTLTQQVALKMYTYCVAARGVDASHLPVFRSKLQGTLNSSRGWSLNGLVEFKEVASGCNFTAWVTAPELMPTFGAICDSMWSCRVGPNVVINFDRWQNASPSWNAAGGSLDEYRNMVINHETGHWLGFGHSHCEGAGQPAPVMQQQSIDLQGCTFNAWPAASELSAYRSGLGI